MLPNQCGVWVSNSATSPAFMTKSSSPSRSRIRLASGTLLVVGHGPSDLHTTMPRPGLAEMGWTADEVADVLGDDWTIVVAEARPRTTTDPEGREITIHDAVLHAHRNPTRG